MFGLPFHLLPSNPESYYTPALLLMAAALTIVPCALISKYRLVGGKRLKRAMWSMAPVILTLCVIDWKTQPGQIFALDAVSVIVYIYLCATSTFLGVFCFPVTFSWSRRRFQMPGGVKLLVAFWSYVGSTGMLIGVFAKNCMMTNTVYHLFTPESLVNIQRYGSVVANSALTGLIVTVAALLIVRLVRKIYSKVHGKITGSRFGRWIGIAKTWIGCKAVDVWHWLRTRFSRLRRSNP